MTKIGDESFEFPIGKDTIYAPMSVSSGTDPSDEVTAEYFFTSAYNVGTDMQDTLSRVSDIEYWDIAFNDADGTPDYDITLTWDTLNSRNSGINELATLDMAYYDGAEWVFLEADATGTLESGSIVTAAGTSLTQSASVTFATGSESAVVNPLPVTFVRFSAELVNLIPNLLWITSSEEDNDYFVIERSLDAVNFDSLDYVPGSGTTNEIHLYTFVDYSYDAKTYYYRIRQVDFDGSYDYSVIRSVSPNNRTIEDESVGVGLEVFPIPLKSGEALTIRYPEASQQEIYSLRLLDNLGVEVMAREVNSNEVVIEDLGSLIRGVYFLQLQTSQGLKSAKLMKINK